jgi:hypothetical protein
MDEPMSSRRVSGEAVGEERSLQLRPAKGVGGWFKMGALTFAIVVALAIIFAVAIIVAAR